VVQLLHQDKEMLGGLEKPILTMELVVAEAALVLLVVLMYPERLPVPEETDHLLIQLGARQLEQAKMSAELIITLEVAAVETVPQRAELVEMAEAERGHPFHRELRLQELRTLAVAVAVGGVVAALRVEVVL
jgi:hypothetical protein